MGKGPLLDERVEDLSVEEVLVEGPLAGRAVLQEQLVVEEGGRVPGALRGCRQQRPQAPANMGRGERTACVVNLMRDMVIT